MMLHIISAGSSRNELSAIMPALVAGMTRVNGPFHYSRDAPARPRGTICPSFVKHHPRKNGGRRECRVLGRTRGLVCEK